MVEKGKFNLDASFQLTGRGLVLVGDLIEGKVAAGNYITFNTGIETVTLKISSVEFVDHISERRAEIGLVLKNEDNNGINELDPLKINKQTCDISTQPLLI